jgi:hypothetical protein
LSTLGSARGFIPRADATRPVHAREIIPSG